MVNAWYPNMNGLTLDKGKRYYLTQFKQGSQEEVFNHTNLSIRSVIECTFGIWKAQ